MTFDDYDSMLERERSLAKRNRVDRKPGKASKYIRNFSQLRPGDKVFLFPAVSGRDRRSVLRNQIDNLTHHCNLVGAEVKGHFDSRSKKTGRVKSRRTSGQRKQFGSKDGYIGSRYEPQYIEDVYLQALKAGADYILAETPDRYARHPDFKTIDAQLNKLRATDQQWKELVKACPIPLMTHLNPDATAKQVHAYRSRRGQSATNNRGGQTSPGCKSRRQLLLWPEVKSLRKKGLSWRSIGKELGIDHSVPYRWAKRRNYPTSNCRCISRNDCTPVPTCKPLKSQHNEQALIGPAQPVNHQCPILRITIRIELTIILIINTYHKL